MPQTAHVTGTVETRQGDGAMQTLPIGPVEVETTEIDATLSWTDGATHAVVAMPLTDFKRHVAKGTIRIEPAPEPASG